MNKRITLWIISLFAVTPVMADIDQTKGNGLYGFVTQGYFKTNTNNFYGKSQSGSFDFNEIGVGAGFVLNDTVSVGGLLLSRKAGNADNGSVRLDNLVFDVKALRGENSITGVRLGRNKIPFGFYNATRDMAMTRPTLLLPQSVYHDHSRNFLINADGLEAYHERWDDESYTRFALLYEKNNGINNPQTEIYFMGMDWPGKLNPDYATGATFTHTFNNTKTRFAGFYGHLPTKYKPGTVDPLTSGEITTDVMWLSGMHEIMPKLTLTAEAFLPRIAYDGLGPLIPNRNVYPLGWYLQATYAHSNSLEFYGRYDQTYKDKFDKSGEKNSAATGMPKHSFYASDWTVGLNYFYSPSLIISAEFHRINGTAFLPRLDNPDPSMTSERWNMFGLQASYNFR